MSAVVNAESWAVRDALVAKHYPYIGDLLDFDDYRLCNVLDGVEGDKPPSRWLRLELCQIPSRAWLEWHLFRGFTPGIGRPKIPARVRRFVIEHDGYICGICAGEVEPTDVHLDHVKPHSKGGATKAHNLRVTHSLCNMRKGAKFDGEDQRVQA